MGITLDSGLHIAEIVAIFFWMGISYGDINWLKSELRHLRELCERNFFIK